MRPHQYYSLIKRTGFVFIAIGLAFAIASYMSQGTIDSYVQNSGGNPQVLGAQSFVSICCNPSYVSPKNDMYFDFSSQNASVTVYIMRTNASEIGPLINSSISQSCLPPYGYCGYGYFFGSASSFTTFLATHSNELIKQFIVPKGGFVQTSYFPTDVEPLLILILNPTGTNTTLGLNFNQIGIQIPPALGLEATAGFVLVGAVLVGVAYLAASKKK
jgi:hypothetical protein